MAVQSNNILLLDLTNGRPRTIDTASDQLEVGVDVTLASGSDLVVSGNLTVQGTITSVDSEHLLVEDSHAMFSSNYTTAVARESGLVVNYLPTATTDTVAAGGFTAGVAGVSNPTIATTAATTFSAGDLVLVTGASEPGNNGLFECDSHAANVLTLRGIGTTGATFNFTQNQLITDATAGADLTLVNVAILQAGTDGLWEVASGNNTGSITFADLVTAGAADLQAAYVNGNTITTSGVNGDVEITGTESLSVTATGGAQFSNFVTLNGAGGIELTAASNLAPGELVQIDTSGQAALADNNTGNVLDAFVVGASVDTVLAGATARIASIQGTLVNVTFSAAPAGASNGSEVFLSSTPGVATLTAPSASGETVFSIGILAGANGVLTEVPVYFSPRLVAVIP